jgi:hypothetical protein
MKKLTLLIPVAALMLVAFAFAGAFDPKPLPDVSREDFRADPYIKAAMELQAMGREAAIKALLEVPEEDWKNSAARPAMLNKAIVLCRMLFVPRGTNAFRRAMIGGTDAPGATRLEDWPLDPIEIVDGVPFLVMIGSYRLAGSPESATRYIRYCIDRCDWNPVKYSMPTSKQKHDALSKFLASPKWNQALNDRERIIFENQIK